MLKESIQNALNEQINREFYASFLYLAMAAHFEAANLQGFAQWMYAQSEEEYGHAMRLFHFILDRGGQVELKAVEGPPMQFGGHLAVFEQALAHERLVSEMIDQLYGQAQAENDFATQIHLQWFVTEQVEEEDLISGIVDRLRLAADSNSALLMLDMELGQREGDPAEEA